MDLVTLAKAKKYTDGSILGIDGVLRGKNCTIKSIEKIDGVNTVTFQWTADDGSVKTSTMQVSDGIDGVGTDGKSAYQVWLDLGNTGTEEDFINALVENSNQMKNWLKGKTINFLGDSITRGHISNAEVMERPYPANVATLLNCTCNNYGVSGSTLVDSSAPYSHKSFIDRMVDMDKTASVNVVMGGTNDFNFNQILLGNLSDTGASTIYGALKTIAEYLISEFPNAINIFCAPLRQIAKNNGRYAMEELVYAIKSVAKRYGFVFIDTYHNLPSWRPDNAVLLSRYGVNGTDYTHPNQLFSDTIFGKYMATSILRLDGGSAITPKDEPFSRVILDLTNYANGDWWKGSIKGWVEEGFLHAYFYNAMLLKPNGGANFNEDSSWNNAEYKLNVPTDGIVLGWTPIHEFQTNNILGFMYAGNGLNGFAWVGNPQYEGSFPSGVTFASIDIPLDR